MMSTLSGLVLGIAAAGAVTVFYGDALNRKLCEMIHATELTVQTTAAVPASVMEPEPRPPAASAAAPSEPAATPAVAPPDALLARRWQEFAEQSGELQAIGEFRWRDCFRRAAATYGVAEPLLLAVASGESGFDSAARSDRDAIGLMQIRWPDTSKHLGIHRQADLYDPCTNVSAGARYLVELTERYKNDLHRTIAAYNYGPGKIDEGPLPPGAQWYSQYIYQHLQRVLGRHHVSSSDLLPVADSGDTGYRVLMSFNQLYRARDFMAFLQTQEPELSLAQRSETLGRYEVILLYQDEAERQWAFEAIARNGLVTLNDTPN